jgi:hypothetical protein
MMVKNNLAKKKKRCVCFPEKQRFLKKQRKSMSTTLEFGAPDTKWYVKNDCNTSYWFKRDGTLQLKALGPDSEEYTAQCNYSVGTLSDGEGGPSARGVTVSDCNLVIKGSSVSVRFPGLQESFAFGKCTPNLDSCTVTVWTSSNRNAVGNNIDFTQNRPTPTNCPTVQQT